MTKKGVLVVDPWHARKIGRQTAAENMATYLEERDYEADVTSNDISSKVREDSLYGVIFIIRQHEMRKSFSDIRAYQPYAKIVVYAAGEYLKTHEGDIKKVGAIAIQRTPHGLDYRTKAEIAAAIEPNQGSGTGVGFAV